MPSLKETTEKLTEGLEGSFKELRSELSNGELDFDKLTSIADQISEQADGLAQTFSSVNETLMERIGQAKGGGNSSSGSSRKQERSQSGSRS